jgi:curved DNA-binding protein CbpA
MDRNERDYYALLGIKPSASGDEIDRAYRRAARATHPDIHPDEPSAGERFTAIAIAYETLSDPGRRASYDRARPAAAAPAHRVVPVGPQPRKPSSAPAPLQPRPGVRPIPPGAAVRQETRLTLFGDDLFQLAASLSRLLRSTWPST